jgi:hypothetical protein
MLQAARKARDGGNGREFVYRAIVERHFGKHTGLPPSAKACPEGRCWREARPQGRWQAEASRTKQRRGADAGRLNPGESSWALRSIKSMASSG